MPVTGCQCRVGSGPGLPTADGGAQSQPASVPTPGRRPPRLAVSAMCATVNAMAVL
jgi:hypothetical protein